MNKSDLIIACPKGRLETKIVDFLKARGLDFEKDFFNEESRKLTFSSNFKNKIHDNTAERNSKAVATQHAKFSPRNRHPNPQKRAPTNGENKTKTSILY